MIAFKSFVYLHKMSDDECTMEDLVSLLIAIEAAEDIPHIRECPYHPLVQNAQYAASEAMHIYDGIVDEACVKVLKDNGFRVFPGEVDVFGCLTGCIETTKGIIMFG
jgi:hypothetical protein